MSRSKHTDPRSIRAARRLRAPREKRGSGDISRIRRSLGRLKAIGVSIVPEHGPTQEPRTSRPRVITHLPQAGFHHPASECDILSLLDAVGPIARYGVTSIQLREAPPVHCGSLPAFGTYRAPGGIVMYAQPSLPWRIQGLIGVSTRLRLERSGAVLTSLPDAGVTLVDWPEETLRAFMLEEVLLHEIGHHVLQHHNGKRPVRIARTRDHEASAQRFASKQLAALAGQRPGAE